MSEENLERPNYYAIIPADVRYSDISASAKLLYGEISALANKTGTCWASNKYFADLYKVNVDAISRWVKQLADAGFVSTKIIKSQGNRRYIKLMNAPIMKKDDSYYEKAQVNNNTKNSNNVVLEKELLETVNRITKRAFRTLPNKGVKKLLDTFTLVEISSSLSALAADDWHAERLKELSLDYLIRPTTIDKFLGIAKKDGADVPTYTDEQRAADKAEALRRRDAVRAMGNGAK